MEKIRKSYEFSRIYKFGKKLSGRYILIFENKSDTMKFGVVASKKVGNSVYRSRAKRLLREAIRLNMNLFRNNREYVLVAKASIGENMKEIKFENIEKDLQKIMRNKK